VNVTGAWVTTEIRRMRGEFEAARLAAELGCEVTPHPELAGRVEARDPLPGLWLVIGTPDEVRAEVRRFGARRK
jgi:hypothetical protein